MTLIFTYKYNLKLQLPGAMNNLRHLGQTKKQIKYQYKGKRIQVKFWLNLTIALKKNLAD